MRHIQTKSKRVKYIHQRLKYLFSATCPTRELWSRIFVSAISGVSSVDILSGGCRSRRPFSKNPTGLHGITNQIGRLQCPLRRSFRYLERGSINSPAVLENANDAETLIALAEQNPILVHYEHEPAFAALRARHRQPRSNSHFRVST